MYFMYCCNIFSTMKLYYMNDSTIQSFKDIKYIGSEFTETLIILNYTLPLDLLIFIWWNAHLFFHFISNGNGISFIFVDLLCYTMCLKIYWKFAGWNPFILKGMAEEEWDFPLKEEKMSHSKYFFLQKSSKKSWQPCLKRRLHPCHFG